MNRQMKRAQERAEKQQKRAAPERPSASTTAARRVQASERRQRTGARQFLREVRLELKKVDWPTRKELITYTLVVLVTIIVVTTYVFGLDTVFERAIFSLLD